MSRPASVLRSARFWAALVPLAILLIASAAAWSASPPIVSHQGRLLDSDDKPLSGNYTLVFTLYDVPTGGAALWTEDHVGVPVSNGLFSVELGSTIPLPLDLFAPGSGGGGGGGAGGMFLQVTVNGTELLPRLRIGSVPYAMSSSRLSGDVTTSPNSLSVGDLDGDGIADVALVSDATSARLAIKTKGTSAQRYSSGGDCDDTDATLFVDCDDEGDGLPDAGGSMVAKESRSILKQYFETGDIPTETQRVDTTDGGGVRSVAIGDLDGDGHPEVAVRSSVTTSSPPAGMDPLTASVRCDSDSDDDGLSDNDASMTVTPGTSSVAINTKGTGADKGRVIATSTPDSALVTCSVEDGGVPDGDATIKVTPGACSVAINTKGTGADKNRTIMTTTPDSVVTETTFEFENSLLMPALMKAKEKANRTKCGNNLRCFSPVVDTETETSVDTAGARLAIKTKGTSAHRTSAEIGAVVENSASVRCDSDDDGDGVPEDEGFMSVMPGTCSVAINTKGTGADKNRVISTTTPDSVVNESTFEFQDALLLPALTKIKEKANKTKCSSALRCQTSTVTSESEAACDTTAASMVWTSSSTLGTSSSIAIRASLDPLANPIEHSSGAVLTPGGTWTNASDASLKENFQPVDGAELLEKIAELPISQWNYKAESDDVTHIGPTAQDFKDAFGVGTNDKTISTIDPSGIALAAIKELNKQNRDLQKENAELKKQLESLSQKVDELLKRK